MTGEKISIIIPAKNCEKTIRRALDSVKRQTYKDLEVVIVDDGSTDGTRKIIEDFKKDGDIDCKTVYFENSGGASKARNAGAGAAAGDLLVFMDSDIVPSENALEEIVKFNERNGDVSGFFGSFIPKLESNNILGRYKNLYLCYIHPAPDEKVSALDTSLCFIDKDIFGKFKFDEKIRYMSEDSDLARRLAKAGHSIRRAPEVKMEHLKEYTFKGFIKSEYLRGKAFSRLFLKALLKDKKESGKDTYYLKPLFVFINVGLMPFLILFSALSFLMNSHAAAFLAGAILLYMVVINIGFWNYIRKIEGLPFALLSVAISFIDIAVMDAGITVTAINILTGNDPVLEPE